MLSDSESDLPCNYFYNNAYYFLGTLAENDPMLYTTTNMLNEYAAFGFCKKLKDFPDKIETNTVS